MKSHLLSIEQLSKDEILHYLANAQSFIEVSERDIKKVPTLRGKAVVNLFLEPSTRTRTSFEIAAKRLSAEAINISGSTSSTTKGETLLDTAWNIESMAPDVLVVRHSASGAAEFLSKHLTRTAVVNAGDGTHEHPTQGLLDCLALRERLQSQGDDLVGKTVAIVGDIRHSRVARSDIWALHRLGNKVRLVGPPTLLPKEFELAEAFIPGLELYHNLEEGLAGVDAVIVLRLQRERQKDHYFPTIDEYCNAFCVTEKVLQRVAPKALVMHPGPANRGVEISTEVLDGPRSLVQRQVTLGVAVRMAVLFQHALDGASGELE